MKIMTASDIHGSAAACAALLEAYRRESPDRLLLLGDILYHGPRNPLPEEYAPQKVAAMLNEVRERILCVRGNCDAEVDQYLLEFSIMAEYCIFPCGSRTVHAVHGHRFPDAVPAGDIIVSGHTHVLTAREEDGRLYLNPGSVALPKDGFRGYILFEDGCASFRHLDGREQRRISL